MSRRLGIASAAAALLLFAGCGNSDRPRLARGAPCAACSMAIEDLRFGCARRANGAWRYFDSIECLIRDAGPAGPAPAWLADYDTRELHPAEALWVVKGEFPSPMGGGFAAFLRRTTADSVAAETRGRVERLAAFAGGAR